MAHFFDISTLITLYAALIAILTGLIYIGKPNLLIIIQKELIHELSEDYKQWMEKAERYSHGTRLSGPKIRIRRALGRFSQDFSIPHSVLIVSGLAFVAWLFCLFMLVAGYVYSGMKNYTTINVILLVAQFNLIAMGVTSWFGQNNYVTRPVLYLSSTMFWWIVFTTLGMLMGISGFFFQVISYSFLPYVFYTITLIPLIPIAAFIWSAYGVYRDEKQKFDHLKNLVIDFEKFRLEESLRQKKK